MRGWGSAIPIRLEQRGMKERYDPRPIEEKWQKYWEDKRLFRVAEDPEKEKFYLLEMYPYPSGKMHMGHLRNYSIGDVVARYKKNRGYNVLHPMGWDAFGMPAENAAIEHGVHPAKWTYQNIDTMRDQLKRMGFSYDWDRELATCDVTYYRWEQWLFLKMYEKGLAYRKRSYVNWCEPCQTVLANEQVEAGLCWRCHSEVTQKELDQWFFKITKYAEELLGYLKKLPGWPGRVLTMQENWIGRSVGAEIHFPFEDSTDAITVFTTRQDTVFGATFMSLAAEHPLTIELSKETPQAELVRNFVEKVRRQDRTIRSSEDIEKEGVFTGAYCLNPMTKARIPIYVANFVLMEYGTGAVMAVPTHDQRDFEFAKKYNLPLTVVIQPPGEKISEESMTEAYEGEGTLVHSGPFDGMTSQEAREAVNEFLEKNNLGKRSVNYRLKDWGISRQRYWGAPIPIIYCDQCGIRPVKEEDLPVVLPYDVEVTGTGESLLASLPSFVETTCPKCDGPARRETDTMDTFVESSWYFERFACPDYDKGILDRKRVDYWMPVDQYIGGIEHAILHLLYSRFFTKVLRDEDIVGVDEPFTRLLTQGMVCKEVVRCPIHGLRYPHEVKEGRCTQCDRSVEVGGKEKMSKSKRNVVDPEEMIGRYGADTTRLFCLFASPPEKDLDWSDQGIEGCSRFLHRVWRIVLNHLDTVRKATLPAPGDVFEGADQELHRKTHRTIKKVTEDIERFHFNTAISAIMELVNAAYRFEPKTEAAPSVLREATEMTVLTLSPFVPHIAEELWRTLGRKDSIIRMAWPQYDPVATADEEMLVVIQINGKFRDRMTVSASLGEEEVKQAALSRERVLNFTEGKQIKKTIVVQKKLINVVCG
jgi:leucyl-tRNA synthetase